MEQAIEKGTPTDLEPVERKRRSREWRAATMKGILPANPVSKVGADWRPETAVRASS